MNVKWKLYHRLDRQWGRLLPNGSFNGMISSVVKGDADMVTATPNLTPQRSDAVKHIVRNMLD